MAKKITARTLPGVNSPAPRDYEAAHAAVARTAAEEGIVLLKNSILPLNKGSRLAVYGAGVSKTVKGGTGSGDVNERGSVSVLEGLRHAGFTIVNPEWAEDYDRRYAAARQAWREEIEEKARHTAGQYGFFFAYSSTPFRMPPGAPPQAADTDTALYVLARVAGEGSDRRAAEGDYYLSREEHRLLADVCGLYARVIVLVNAGGVVDLSFLEEFPQIKALLVISQPGMEGGHAVADVLTGEVNPSGKLTDTWALRYEDYPGAASFGLGGNTEMYTEGLYVGYRYFDTFRVPVRYGFGYGLSYTSFAVQVRSVSTDAAGRVAVSAAVTNTGAIAGKEVVQVYAGLPDGRLEKEARRLAAFGKTRLLAPGETEEMALSFDAAALASYEETSAAWILEKGLYGVYVGSSLQDSCLEAVLVLEAEKVLRKVRNICPPQQALNALSQPEELRARRREETAEAAKRVPNIHYDLSGVETETVVYDAREPEDEAAALVRTLTDEQLIRLATGDPGKGQGSALGSAGISVPGSAGETSSCALEQGIANIVLADGPAGLRLNPYYYVNDGKAGMLPFEASLEHGFFYNGPELPGEKYYQFCTAVPVGTMLAQSWNMPLLERVGDIVGEEMELFGVQLWLAPGMNIHRNPLCGRNFEYYAEDPLVSGRCAAAITRGVQRHRGVGTTIKHYACNNREDRRMTSDSVLSERVLREVYLRGFEIAVREGRPLSIMTSYNLVNGVHAANSGDLCTVVARREFGFDGVIMTDWTTTNQDASCTAAGCMRAGNDLVMPGLPEDHDNLRAELAAGTLTVEQLRSCVTHLVRVILRTNRYEEA